MGPVDFNELGLAGRNSIEVRVVYSPELNILPMILSNTVDGRNPANQLRLVVYPFLCMFIPLFNEIFKHRRMFVSPDF